MLSMTIAGRLGGEVKTGSYGDQATASFSVACYCGWDRKTNQAKTTWVRVTVWGKQAERAVERLSKGSPVTVTGDGELRSWVDNQNVEHTTLQLSARSWECFEKVQQQPASSAQASGWRQPDGKLRNTEPPIDPDAPF